MSREYPWIEEEMIHASSARRKSKPTYPADHQVGMKVPKGGSDCAKCEYLGPNGTTCLNKGFVMWNGSDALPAASDEYCCDFFEAS